MQTIKIDKLLTFRLYDVAIIMFLIGTLMSSWVVLRAETFSAKEISVLLTVAPLLMLFQTVLERLISTDRLLKLILVLDIIYPAVYILFYFDMVKEYLIIDTLVGGIFGLLYSLRFSRLNDVIKMHFNTSEYSSYRMSLNAAASLSGIILSAVLLLWISPLTLIVVVGLSTSLIGIYLSYRTNVLFRQVLTLEVESSVKWPPKKKED